MLEGYVNLLEIPVGPAAHPPCLQLRPWRGASVRRGGGGGLRAPMGVMTNKLSPSDWLAEAAGPSVLSFPLCPLWWGHGRRHRRTPLCASAHSVMPTSV